MENLRVCGRLERKGAEYFELPDNQLGDEGLNPPSVPESWKNTMGMIKQTSHQNILNTHLPSSYLQSILVVDHQGCWPGYTTEVFAMQRFGSLAELNGVATPQHIPK